MSANSAAVMGMPGTVPAMPFLQRDSDSVWARSAALRDKIYEAVESTCRELNIELLINKSIDFVYPAWVSLEAWLPTGAPGATYRLWCTFQIVPRPYSRFEFEVTISWVRDGKKKTYGPYSPLAATDVAQWVRYLLDKGAKPKTRRHRLRKLPWQIWYPKNKVTRLGRDFLGLAAAAGIIGGLVLALTQPLIGLSGLVMGVICAFITWYRRKVVINAGRPVAEPRTLRLVDNWSTMANELGRDWREVRDQLFKRLGEGLKLNIQSRLEKISYVTPDGKQEREQFVLSQGRGIVFCHVYPYGDDLYIGWDAHLNYGQWVESTLATGYDSRLRAPTAINTVTPGVARVTEYDLIDVNSLTEWVHSRVVQVVKQVMAEHKLDQEIDFKILRGERQSLLRNQESPKRRPLFSRGTD
jgi:hypothetical protein